MNNLLKRVARIPARAGALFSQAASSGAAPQSETQISEDAAAYWTGSSESRFKRDMSHWLGEGRFADEARWRGIGDHHFAMYEALCQRAGKARPIQRMLEWGPGGGANAVRFMAEAEQIYGVDISAPNLDECQRQLAERGMNGFRKVHIPADKPEVCLDAVDGPLDFFLSTAVFQHFPSQEYGVRVARLAHRMLADDGIAIIQTRYDDGQKKFRAKSGNYGSHAITFTSYRIEGFWKICSEIGLAPLWLELNPETNYAFYFLAKRKP